MTLTEADSWVDCLDLLRDWAELYREISDLEVAFRFGNRAELLLRTRAMLRENNYYE